MTNQNRVQPTGDFLAHPAKGMFMGNRGNLHDDSGQLTQRRWKGQGWVTCALSFKDRQHTLGLPGRYTHLFFHDEAVAFAAGHRPCAECRRADYLQFRSAAGITGPIQTFDSCLHKARAVSRTYGQRRHQAEIAGLPDGTFILDDRGVAQLVLNDTLRSFRPEGYMSPKSRPGSGRVTVLTPEPILQAFREGYKPVLNMKD